MGQNHYKYNKNYELEIDDELKYIINQELKVINGKKEIKKFQKLVSKKVGNNFKPSNFKKKFNENETGLKNVIELLNLIYEKNIDREQKIKSNRTIHEVLFDIRDTVELIDNNSKEENYLEKKNGYDKFKLKISTAMDKLLNPKHEIVNHIENFNYDNDNNEKKKIILNNNLESSVNQNINNYNILDYDSNMKNDLNGNIKISKKLNEIKPENYRKILQKYPLKNKIFLD